MIKKDTLATFRVENDLWEQFKAKATEHRFTASALLLQFVGDYVSGRVSSTAGNNTDVRDAHIDNLDIRIDSLEKRIDERIDKLKGELETALQEVRGLIAQSNPKAKAKPSRKSNPVRTARPTEKEPPLSTQELCKRLEVSYSNLATCAKRKDRTTEEQLIAEARKKGQDWRVCDRKGQKLLWERVR